MPHPRKGSIHDIVREIEDQNPWSIKEIVLELLAILGVLGTLTSLLIMYQVVEPDYLTPRRLICICLIAFFAVMLRRAKIHFFDIWRERSILLSRALTEIEESNQKIEYWSKELDKTDQKLSALHTTDAILRGLANQYMQLLSYMRVSPSFKNELENVISSIATTKEEDLDVPETNESDQDS